MKFWDFLQKNLLANKDYLVGYDNSGKYIRIKKEDLVSSIASGVTVPTLQVQYSANSETWHDSYTSGDIFVRIKVGGGSWSGAIRMSVSAYDIWKELGNSGDEEDFIASLKGEPGEVDYSGLELRNINGYTALLESVNTSLQNAKNAIISDIIDAAETMVKDQFNKLQLEDVVAIKNLSESDYITIVTADGLRKVNIGNLSDNVAIRTVSTRVLESSITNQLRILTVTGAQDGSNMDFEVHEKYVAGTALLFLNGQLLTPDKDYKEVPGGFLMLTYAPEDEDVLLFEAVLR